MIIGHQKQLEFLKTVKESGRLGHAYIFSGPAEVGKKTLALKWLSEMTGTDLHENTASPDFLFVAPLVDEKTGKPAQEITVEQIRNLIWKLSLKPASAKIKAAVVDEAHLMNLEAQNCLLKTLEEPPGDAILMLIAQNSRRLLPTIRSRCETVQFNFVSSAQIKNQIKLQATRLGKDIADDRSLEEIVKFSCGRPGRAIDFCADAEGIKKWREAEIEFSRAVAGELPERFGYVKEVSEIEDPNAILQLLEIWQFHFRNKLLENLQVVPVRPAQFDGLDNQNPSLDNLRGLDPCKAAGQKFVFSKAKDSSGYTLQKITAILKKIHDLGVILQTTNANTRLAIENFMLEI